MSYRGSSRYHKIRKLETNSSINYCITISKETVEKFQDNNKFYEIITDKGIFLVKSGCEPIEKIIMD